MAKAADASTVSVGQTVTYRITVNNGGPNTATAVTEQLPEGLDFPSAETASGTYGPATGQWTAGDLDDGNATTLTLRAKASRAGQIHNTATVTSNETGPGTGDDTETVTICAKPALCCGPCAPQKEPHPQAGHHEPT